MEDRSGIKVRESVFGTRSPEPTEEQAPAGPWVTPLLPSTPPLRHPDSQQLPSSVPLLRGSAALEGVSAGVVGRKVK